MQNKELGHAKRYVILTYLVFWCSVALLGVALFASGQNESVKRWGVTICSWGPTVVLLIMFKKLLPGTTIKDWLKKSFAPRIPFGLMLAVTAVLTATMAIAVSMVALRASQSAMSLMDFSLPTLASSVFFTLLQGATGEEAGWRGYLQPIMEQTAGGVVKGSLLVGVVWSFWHTPLWFVSGVQGWNLLLYIVTFILGNLSLAVIIGVCYHRCQNLAVPMWIHFVANLIVVPYAGDATALRYWLFSSIALAAVGFTIWHTATSKVRASTTARLGA